MRTIITTTLFILLSGFVHSAEWFENRTEIDAESVLGWKVTVSPVREPAPSESLHFRPLMEKAIDRDALPFYDQASITFWRYWMDKVTKIASDEEYLKEAVAETDREKRYKIFSARRMREMPLQTIWGERQLFESLNISEAEKRRCIDELSEYFAQLDEAVRSTQFDRDGIHSVDRLQQLRNHARLLTVKSDVEIHEKKFDAACRTINVFYRMAEHLCQNAPMIDCLMALATQGAGQYQLAKLSEHPSAPSLFAALQELKAIPCESLEVFRNEYTQELSGRMPNFLKFTDPDTASNEQAKAYLYSREFTASLIAEFVPDYDRPSADAPDPKQFAEKFETFLQRGEPIARRKLLADGLSRETVDAMSPEKAFLVATARELKEFADEAFRYFPCPYWISQRKFKEFEKHAKPEDATYVLPQLLTATNWLGLKEALTRTQFQHEALILIEAIRLYAGTHDGKLPETLADLEAMSLPVPQINPFTGKPYFWTKTGERTLQLDGPGGFIWRYEITLR